MTWKIRSPESSDGIQVEIGGAAERVCETARSYGADIVVIGAHHYGLVARALGTTAARIVNRMDHPVFRGPADADRVYRRGRARKRSRQWLTLRPAEGDPNGETRRGRGNCTRQTACGSRRERERVTRTAPSSFARS